MPKWSNGTRYCQDRTSVNIVGRTEPDRKGTEHLQDRILLGPNGRMEPGTVRTEHQSTQSVEQNRIPSVSPVYVVEQGIFKTILVSTVSRTDRVSSG